MLVAVVGTGLKAGVFELGSDSSTGDALKKPTTRVVLFVVGAAFLGLALLTREDSSTQSRPQQPALDLPAIPGFDEPAGEEPKLELSKKSGSAGTRLRVTGSGFAPGETIEIAFHTETMKEVQADTRGVFREVLVQVPTDWDFDGQFDIRATGKTSIKSVRAQFRVTA